MWAIGLTVLAAGIVYLALALDRVPAEALLMFTTVSGIAGGVFAHKNHMQGKP